jgi:hypothetical protein
MGAPYNNTRSKLDRAICAWLVTQPGCGSVNDILPSVSVFLKSYPNTTVETVLSKPQSRFSGNRWCDVHVRIAGSAVKQVPQPGQLAPSQAPRELFDARVGSTIDALMQSDTNGVDLAATAIEITNAGRALAVDPTNGANAQAAAWAAANADMPDFTCIMWLDDGDGPGEITADEENCAWKEVIMFKALACPSNVS